VGVSAWCGVRAWRGGVAVALARCLPAGAGAYAETGGSGEWSREYVDSLVGYLGGWGVPVPGIYRDCLPNHLERDVLRVGGFCISAAMDRSPGVG
jgi:hypothetical protein